MPQILVIEDSEDCQLVINYALKPAGLTVVSATSASQAQKLFTQHKFDMALVDIGLPDGDGLSLVKQLKADQKNKNLPVFFLTGKEDIDSKLKAFEIGADDYLVKPVNPQELRARVEMRLKKSRALNEVALYGKLELNLPLLRARNLDGGKDETIDLTGKEFKILSFLASGEGQVFSRGELVEAIWGKSVHVLDRTVDSHVCAIRRKLGELASYVESIPGEGYRFRSKP